MRQIWRAIVEVIGFQSARGRLVFFLLATLVIFFLPFAALGNLSIWQRLGLDWAPSIGLTRAYWYVLHLDFQAAWQRNPLIYLVLAIGMPLLLVDVRKLMKRRAISS